MLVKLTVDNFKSFNEKMEFSMIPTNKNRKKSEHKVKVGKTFILKNAVIYGANASGKSNFIEIFKFIQYCVCKRTQRQDDIYSIPPEGATFFCKANKKNAQRASEFEIIFTIDNKVYAYGFSAILKECKIKNEWLYELFTNKPAKELFTREEGKVPQLGDTVIKTELDESKMNTYLEDFGINQNQLFLSFMNNGKKYAPDSKITFFKDIFHWFKNSLTVYTPLTRTNNFHYYNDETSLQQINELIKMFDTGITEVSIDKIKLEEIQKELPGVVYRELIEAIEQNFAEASPKSKFIKGISMRHGSNFFYIKKNLGHDPVFSTIKLKHGESFYNFKFKEESDGTQRLFDLLDMLLTKAENKVYVIDEMERSLHPRLTAKFIELFDSMHSSKRNQLIFTTHESSIMDQELFRRDEIWFAERDYNNNSKLYSLELFRERYDKKLSKAYLEGRYGAIPVFKSFKFKDCDNDAK